MGKLIGIYGGSFDPVHIGHLSLAIEMVEAHGLDEVWFCPTGQNPRKYRMSSGPEHRLNMLRLAIEGEPRFRILETEIAKPEPSYTVDTLEELHKAESKSSDPKAFALILGTDSARDFHKWRKPEEIIRLAQPLVGRRIDESGGGLEDEFEGTPDVIAALKRGVTPTRIMEISSIEIRYRLRKGKYCGHLLPRKVLDYIGANHLYLEPSNEARFL